MYTLCCIEHYLERFCIIILFISENNTDGSLMIKDFFEQAKQYKKILLEDKVSSFMVMQTFFS